mmetsp:Transcript_29066/g.44361  ORF Transcript_29066/g.44361 Transcript_29066/m.44361 type:complete len:219 (+) Transcript_29066:1160-1816(+)
MDAAAPSLDSICTVMDAIFQFKIWHFGTVMKLCRFTIRVVSPTNTEGMADDAQFSKIHLEKSLQSCRGSINSASHSLFLILVLFSFFVRVAYRCMEKGSITDIAQNDMFENLMAATVSFFILLVFCKDRNIENKPDRKSGKMMYRLKSGTNSRRCIANSSKSRSLSFSAKSTCALHNATADRRICMSDSKSPTCQGMSSPFLMRSLESSGESELFNRK